MNVGQPFNPWRLFTGIFIPEGLVRAKGISPGAKLAYGRLVRYGGQDGRCYPSVDALGREIGVGERQAQKYIAELERAKLIRRVSRFSGGAQTSNAFEFLWHDLFEGVNDRSGEGVNDSSPKESQIEESHSEESQNGDLGYPTTNRKKRDSRLDSVSPTGERQYPKLREALADYMSLPEDQERIYPTARTVVDIMDTAGGATEHEVVDCLRYLYEERGLKPGTPNVPRHFSWFKTVVAEYFWQHRDRLLVTGNASRSGNQACQLNAEQFDSMSEPF